MSDWLERELARGLTKVSAPASLGERLGFDRPGRSEYPHAFLAVAAAVVVIVAAGYAASRSSALDLYRYTARDTAAARPVELASNRQITLAAFRSQETTEWPLRCDGGAGQASPLRGGNTTALLAHHGGPVERSRASGDAGCGFCHNL